MASRLPPCCSSCCCLAASATAARGGRPGMPEPALSRDESVRRLCCWCCAAGCGPDTGGHAAGDACAGRPVRGSVSTAAQRCPEVCVFACEGRGVGRAHRSPGLCLLHTSYAFPAPLSPAGSAQHPARSGRPQPGCKGQPATGPVRRAAAVSLTSAPPEAEGMRDDLRGLPPQPPWAGSPQLLLRGDIASDMPPAMSLPLSVKGAALGEAEPASSAASDSCVSSTGLLHRPELAPAGGGGQRGEEGVRGLAAGALPGTIARGSRRRSSHCHVGPTAPATPPPRCLAATLLHFPIGPAAWHRRRHGAECRGSAVAGACRLLATSKAHSPEGQGSSCRGGRGMPLERLLIRRVSGAQGS
jgi:hypothetical protein